MYSTRYFREDTALSLARLAIEEYAKDINVFETGLFEPAQANQDNVHGFSKSRDCSLAMLREVLKLLEGCSAALNRFVTHFENHFLAQRSSTKGLLALPVELLSYILGLACTSPDRYQTKSRSVESAITLRKVCSRFYRIIMDTPRAWSDISTNYSNNRLEHALELSKSVPLAMDLDYYSPQSDDNDVQTLRKVLSSHIPRCFKLAFELRGVYGYPLEPIVRNKPVLTHLEHLEVLGFGTFKWFLSECSIPSLVEFRMRSEEFKFVKNIIGPRLTTCSLEFGYSYGSTDLWEDSESNSLYSLLCVLAQAPSLKNLSLHLVLRDMTRRNLPLATWADSLRQKFPRLTNFHLQIHRGGGGGDHVGSDNRHMLLLLMDMPKLENMLIGFKNSTQEELVRVGGQVDADVGCLQTLHIGDISYPELREFSVEYQGDHGHLSAGRHPLLDTLAKMPALERLTLNGTDLDLLGKGYRPKDIQRWQAIPPLHKITFKNQPITVPYLRGFLQGFRNAHGKDCLKEINVEGCTIRGTSHHMRQLDDIVDVN